jgi:hypothetical protein
MSAKSEIRMAMAGFLSWVLPGAGHLLIGERARGVILIAVIAVTFWTGIAVGGVKNTMNYDQRRLWFMGQICAGSHALVAMGWSQLLPDENELIAYGHEEEISVVYTAICGMLNILIIFDVLARAERQALEAASQKSPPTGKRGAT